MNSRAANVSSVKRSRARRRSVPSSPSATANTLASTTITFCPKVTHSCAKRHSATVTCRGALEDLIQSWLTRIGDQTAPKVFLQRLVCACSAFPQDPMSVLRHIFDLQLRASSSCADVTTVRRHAVTLCRTNSSTCQHSAGQRRRPRPKLAARTPNRPPAIAPGRGRLHRLRRKDPPRRLGREPRTRSSRPSPFEQ